MSSTLQHEQIRLLGMTTERLMNLCGVHHQNIKIIEQSLDVTIKSTQNGLTVSGESKRRTQRTRQILERLLTQADRPIPIETLHLLLNHKELSIAMPQIKLNRKTVLPKNNAQEDYMKCIDLNDIIFAVGPAGTGKTWLAVTKAIESFEKGEVHRLIFVRPAVEAGEKLGFLPGDLVEKVLPYLRPIYDALYEMIGFKETQKLIQTDVIEILPLAFMRGRTLNDAFIILDEAQNTTIPQMKMFLTRMGFGSKTVITGDTTQVDLPRDTPSGLLHALGMLRSLEGIGIQTFSSREVVRHPLVSRIVDCYENQNKGK